MARRRRRRSQPLARTRLGRLRRGLQPPRTLRPTRAGWVFFALTFGVGFAALNTGNNLLYLVLSLMLAFLVLSGALSEAALRGVAVRRKLPAEIFAGKTGQLAAVDVSNALKRVPSFALVIEDLAFDPHRPNATVPLGRAFVLRVAPGASERKFYTLRWPARGDLRLYGFRVSTRFPFGLFTKALLLEAPDETLVYPSLEPALRAGERRGEAEGRAPIATPASGTEVAGVRDWRAGDPARRIHWRASLRRGALVVRESEGERQTEQEVRLRTRGAQRGEPFERAVSRAASETVALLDAGALVTLRTDTQRFAPGDGPAQRTRLLRFLATVAPETPA